MSKVTMQALDYAHRSQNDTFETVLQRRLSRRGFLKGALASTSVLVLGPSLVGQGSQASTEQGGTLTFQPIQLSDEDRVIVSPGYAVEVLIRWGEPLHPDVPGFDVQRQTAELQAQQFGYNCDWLAFFALPQLRSHHSDRGLLAVNHEYTNPELMFLGYVSGSPTQEQVDVELAAHGLSILEVVRLPLGGWRCHVDSDFNRRITGETPIEIAGPAAGHDWMKVSYDSTGTLVHGTLNNCAGGETPWGTILTCEENFHQYFANRHALADDDPRKAVHARYGLPTGLSERRWELYHPRFDLAEEPNEPFRFGWKGFASQADVLINTRRAADLLEATRMDRPEDIEANPVNGKVYCVMTNNTQRTAAQIDGPNPRGPNRHGHIIELTEDNNDHTAETFTWAIFLLCGDPANPEDAAFFAGFDPRLVSPISSPDNITFDLHGNLWIATDGQPSTFEMNDGVYAVPVEGPERGYLRQFLSGVPDGEVASLFFSPDNQALFVSIQHPGEGSSLDNPSSTWPDGTIPPRPSVIIVEKTAVAMSSAANQRLPSKP